MARSLEMNFVREILRLTEIMNLSQRETAKAVNKSGDSVSNVIKMAKANNITYQDALRMNDDVLKIIFILIQILIEIFPNLIWNILINK